MPLRRRHASPSPEAQNEAPKSRWDEMFGGPGESSIVDAMREWTDKDEPRPRRILGSPVPEQEHEADSAFEDEAVEEPIAELDDSAVSDFVARIRNRKNRQQQEQEAEVALEPAPEAFELPEPAEQPEPEAFSPLSRPPCGRW
jgi:hypothetical protein